MKIFNKQFMKKMHCGLPLLLLAVILSACSSSDDGAVSETPVTYSGLNTEATLTNTNAPSLAADAYSSGDTGESMALSVTDTGANSSSSPRVINVANTLKKVMNTIEIENSISSSAVSRAVASDTIPSSNTCSVNTGYASFTVNANEFTGDFSGTLSFSNFCEDDEYITGNVGFSGNVDIADPNNPVLNYFTMSMAVLTVIDGSESYSVGGTLNYTSSPSESVSINMALRDNNTGETYKAVYTITSTVGTDGGGPYEAITLNGQFFHHAEGFVTVATTTPIKVYDGDSWPSEGEYTITGENGTATITVNIDGVSFDIVVNYNDLTSYGPVTLNWADV